jgi:ligand-binding sensor domain-containing protein
MCCFAAGTAWCGSATDGGLFTLTEAGGQVTIRRVELRLPSHPDLLVQVWTILEDGGGSIWMGTRFGLMRLLPDGRTVHYPITFSAF